MTKSRFFYLSTLLPKSRHSFYFYQWANLDLFTYLCVNRNIGIQDMASSNLALLACSLNIEFVLYSSLLIRKRHSSSFEDNMHAKFLSVMHQFYSP